MDAHLDLADAADDIAIETGFSGTPQEGVLFRRKITLPAFERACFYSGECWRVESAAGWAVADRWSMNANRVLPWMTGPDLGVLHAPRYMEVDGLGTPKPGGATALFRLAGGGCLALQALVGDESIAWIEVDPDGAPTLVCGTLGTEPVAGDLPLLAWRRDATAAGALRRLWADLSAHPALGRWVRPRAEKTYPEVLAHLGWCSWEEYKGGIDAALLLDAVDTLAAGPAPVRWVLVDDGHVSHRDRQLTRFDPNEKFPDGWGPLLARRDPAGIAWFGLWLNFNGYWANVHPDHALDGLDDALMPVPGGGCLPRPEQAAADAFYGAMMETGAAGFDFVKVDNQAQNLEQYRGTANAARAAVCNARGLDAATHARGLPLINCMAHNHACAFHWTHSPVSRCSIDYKLNDAFKARQHLYQSYHNTLWLGPIVWPDHDMFHASDPVCGPTMATSKALSGAPVYLSDAPADLPAEAVRPLCIGDGRILRPLAPAAPLPDCEFVDPLKERTAYRVIAPLAHGAAAVCVYNLFHGEADVTLEAAITPADYVHASMLLQPWPGPWVLPPEGLVAWDVAGAAGARLGDKLTCQLTGLADRLFLLVPVEAGWGVVGRSDKLLGPAAVTAIERGADRLVLELVEGGPVVVFSETAPACDGAPVEPLGNGFWRIALPVGPGPARVVLSRPVR
ncbi:MAG: Sip1-related alpha-galactosidase [Planctomycetota bacterium]